MDLLPAKEKKSVFKRALSCAARHKTFTVFAILGALAAAVYIISRFSPAFAEFVTRYPGHAVRWLFAKLTGWLPFSLAETLLVTIPLMLAAIIYVSIRLSKTRKDWFGRMMRFLICVLLAVVITFGIGFGPAYFRNSLAQNLGLADSPVSGEELYETALWLTEKIDAELSRVAFGSGGESHMPYSYYELTDKINSAFDKYASDKDFITHFSCQVKYVALSHYMTYTHISGVYAFFTGEANVNFNYPDFVVPFTVAHEMSHQRGIAREDEANFTAFLVCISSDDPFIRYSGYVNVLREVMSALYKSDKELYNDYRKNHYPAQVGAEMSAYSRFFEPYRESTAAQVVSKTNDAYLKSQSVKEGERSYGLVTDLAVAYYLTCIKNAPGQ